MNTTILITWWYGYIWSHIAVELLETWYDIIIIDNLQNSKKIVWDWINTIWWKPHIFLEGDILDIDFLNHVFSTYTIDSVIHCAALKAVWESCSKPFEYYQTNILWTANLLKSMKEAWVHKILFSSSTTVYDIQRCEPPFDESYPTWWTSSPYGTTKVVNEHMMRDYALHQWFEVLSLRYFNPIGAHDSWFIGEDPAQPPTTLLPILLQTLTWHRDSMVVYGSDYDTPDGTCLRDYIHVCDVAKAHVFGIRWLVENKKSIFEPVNIWTWTPTSVLELIKEVEECTSKKIPRSHGDRRPWDIAVAYAKKDHAKNLLWWESQFTITKAVSDAWKFWIAHFEA